MTAPLADHLGPEGAALPGVIRALHLGPGERCFRGEVDVTTGSGLAALATRLAGFPPSMTRAPLTLTIRPDGPLAEIWTRTFGSHVTRSRLWRRDGRLRERLGPITSELLPRIGGAGLGFDTGASWFLGLRLPAALAPIGRVETWAEGDRYHFDITGRIPVFGQVIRYRGWLRPD